MSVPEYTPLSSQMDRILSTDFTTFESPSKLARGEMINNCWIYVSQNGIKKKSSISTKHLLNQLEGVWQHLGECCTVNYGVFPFTVLDDIIGEVQQVESV